MTKKEQKELAQQKLDIYSGILFNNPEFAPGGADEIIYQFDCAEFQELRETYRLEEVSGKGSDFNRAKRLLHYFAPKLTHSSWYDNHVACNALSLLAYSFNNPEQGINCLNKSKILQECFLASGIYARRVSIMPYSPYDFDNHVVTEIYDRALEKWIMLDPTTDGYFIDEHKTPLSLLEMRQRFAAAEFVTFVKTTDSLKDIHALREKYISENAYICKNLFYFCMDRVSTFGTGNEKGRLAFVPVNYSIREKRKANIKYRINNLPKGFEDYKKDLEEALRKAAEYEEDERTDIASMLKKPF